MDLAKRVARHLKKNGAIAYNRRDYCGTDLLFQGGQYMHTSWTMGIQWCTGLRKKDGPSIMFTNSLPGWLGLLLEYV